MPGLLSNIFEADEAGDGQHGGALQGGEPQAADGSSGADASDNHEASGSSNALAVSGDGGFHFDPTINVHSQMSGSYETPDGTQHDWSSTDDVDFHTDVGATLGVLAGADQDDFASAS